MLFGEVLPLVLVVFWSSAHCVCFLLFHCFVSGLQGPYGSVISGDVDLAIPVLLTTIRTCSLKDGESVRDQPTFFRDCHE